jgi:hypothetical protein
LDAEISTSCRLCSVRGSSTHHRQLIVTPAAVFYAHLYLVSPVPPRSHLSRSPDPTDPPCAQTLADFLPVAASVTMVSLQAAFSSCACSPLSRFLSLHLLHLHDSVENRLAARPTATDDQEKRKRRADSRHQHARRSTDTTRRTRRPRGTFGTPYYFSSSHPRPPPSGSSSLSH